MRTNQKLVSIYTGTCLRLFEIGAPFTHPNKRLKNSVAISESLIPHLEVIDGSVYVP